MAKLQGQLIAHPAPNQPGWWAYRKLHNGTLLEVQLTQAEWNELHERVRQKELERLRELDGHPLNAAARLVMQVAGELPLGNEISIISLARYAFDEDVSSSDERFLEICDWGRSLAAMQKAIWVLEEEGLDPDKLRSLNLQDAAWRVVGILLP